MGEAVIPFIAMERLRMETDGDGVTTLVAAKCCPLACHYCLNRRVLSEECPSRPVTVRELIDMVRIDDLYFRATGGGVVFGGGESLLHAEYIAEFAKARPKGWKVIAETCLNVPEELLRKALPAVDYWIVDIKDMNPDIYRAYTGKDNARVKENLCILAEEGRAGDVTVRVPLIPEFNTEEDCRRSVDELVAIAKWNRLDVFRYIVRDSES